MAKAGDAYIDVVGNFTPFEKQIAALPTSRVGRSMEKVGRSLTRNLTLPLVGIGGIAAKMSLDFQRSMSLISTQAGGTKKEVKKLEGQVLNLAKASKFGPNKLAEALFHVESSGYRGAKAVSMLNEAQKLATVGNSELDQTTYALVSAIKALGQEGGKTNKVAAEMNAIVGHGDIRMEEFGASLATGIIPSAVTVGLKLRDIGAAMDVMTARGIPAQRAAYNLRMTFSKLAAPTKAGAAALEEIGIHSTQLAVTMRQRGLGAAVKELADHLNAVSKVKAGTIISAAFGGGRTSSGIQTLIQNVGELQKKYGEIAGSVGKYNQNVHEAEEQPLVKMEKAWSSIQVSLIKIGGILVPIIVPAFEKIANLASKFGEWVNGLSPAGKKLFVDAGLFLAAAGPGLTIAGKLVRTYGTFALVLRKTAEAFGLVTAAQESNAAAGATSTIASRASAAFSGSTYSLARSFGYGRGASLYAQAGATAKNFASGLARAVPSAIAIAGVGNILASAVSGNTKAAAFKAGGAIAGTLAGAIAGSFVGNPMMGAMIGGGIGSLLGGVVGSLFGSEKKLTAIQGRVAAQTKVATAAMKSQRDASQNLAKAQDNLVAANRRHEQSTKRVTSAHQALNSAVKKFGPDSHQAREAELTLAEAQHKDAKTANEAKDAHRLSERQLRLYRLETVKGVAAEKERLPSLDAQIRRLGKKSDEEKHNIPLLRRVTSLEETAGEVRTNLAKTFAHAQEVGGKKFAHSLEKMTTEQAAFGRHFSGIGKAAQGVKQRIEEFANRGGASFGTFGHRVTSNTEIFKEDAKSISEATGIAVNKIETRLAAALKKMGVSVANFGGSGSGGHGGPGSHLPTGHQRGGPINMGASSGDTVPAMLERGEYVLNRKAVAAIGHQNLDAVNFGAAPRFQRGGGIEEPRLGGPSGSLRSLGQGAIHQVYEGAKSYLAKHKPHGGAGYISGGGGPVMAQIARILFRHGANKVGAAGIIGNAYAESTLNPGAVGTGGGGLWGFTSGAISLAALQAFAKRSRKPWTDVGLQTQFMLGHGGQGLIPALNKQPNAAAAAALFMNQWERPGIPRQDVREAGARAAFAKGYRRGGLIGDLPDRGASQAELAYWRKLGIPGFTKGGSTKKAPSALERMLARAKQLAAWHIPYVLGGGHSGFSGHPSSLDCSGAVSDVLHAGGFLGTPEVSGAMEGFGQSGAGKVTIFANAGHAFMNLLGRFWGTSVDDSGAGGLGFHPAPPASYLAAFVKRHVPEGALGSGVSGSGFTNKIPAQIGAHIVGGATSAGGTNAPGHVQVDTGKLPSFGSLPSNLHGCRVELAQRRSELAQYKLAIKRTKDVETRHALQANINLLRSRIKALVKQQARLVAKQFKERTKAKIASRGTFPQLEAWLKEKEGNYNYAQQIAEQVLALEPEENAGPYIEGQESSALGGVLGSEAIWRNSILTGEGKVTQRITSLQGQIGAIEGLKGKHRRAYNKQKYRIPALQKAITAAKGLFDPNTKAGSLEEQLVNVQGLRGPRGPISPLPSQPVAGVFGGLIWDTQMAIRELGLKVKQAVGSGSGEANSGRTELLEELLRQANQRTLVSETGYGVLSGFPPYAGKAHTGAIVPGPPTQERTMVVQGGEGIFTAEQMAAMGGSAGAGDVEVHVHGDIVSKHRDPVEVVINDRRFAPAVQRHSKAGRGVGIATPGGARR